MTDDGAALVLVEQLGDGVTVLTLNRPERLNALTDGLVRALHGALADVADDAECRVAILTGAGRGFCSGFDLKSETADEASGEAADPGIARTYRQQQRWSSLVARIHALPVPVIAAVNGPAAGGGFALAAAADLRVVSTSATFLVANVKIGLSGGDFGLTYFLPRLVGAGRAAELLFTGRRLDPVEADRWGLVNRLVEPGDLMASAVELARQISANATFAVGLTKEMLALGINSSSLADTLVLENRTQVLASQSGDIAEAIAAFRDKRPPAFATR